MMISYAPWRKIQLYLDAFGPKHNDFAAALDNVKCRLVPAERQYVINRYIDPPV